MNKLQKISCVGLIASFLFVLIFSSVSVQANEFLDDGIGAGGEFVDPIGGEAPGTTITNEFLDDSIGAVANPVFVDPIDGSVSGNNNEDDGFLDDSIGAVPNPDFIDPVTGDGTGSENGGSGNPVYNESEVVNYYGDINYNETTNYYNTNYNYDVTFGDNATVIDNIGNVGELNNYQGVSNVEAPEAPILYNDYNYDYDYSYRLNSRSYSRTYYSDYYGYDYDYPVYYQSTSRPNVREFSETCSSYIKDVTRLGNRVKFTVQNPITKETIAVFSVVI